jgi:DNA-binding NtrC family response regulator
LRRILIVDDDRRILQLLGDCFKHAYTVETAMNGGEALAIVRRQRPDLVLLDIMLPGMSGIHLLNEIKRTDSTIAVVIMTGHGNAALAAEALQSGAARYVSKPFNLNDLNRLVAEIIAKPSGAA